MRRSPISIMLLAVLVAVPALAPCAASTPQKPACHMGDCQSGQPVAKALKPCCCSEGGRTAEPVTDNGTAPSQVSPISQPSGAAEALDMPASAVPAGTAQIPDPVPLYILHASLLA